MIIIFFAVVGDKIIATIVERREAPRAAGMICFIDGKMA